MTIESIVADTDMVAVRVRSAGTNLGKLGGFAPPTNKRFAAEQSHWYRVAGGSSASTSATRDDLTAMLQMRVIHPLDRHERAELRIVRRGIAGATELGGKKTVLVLDVAQIVEEAVASGGAEAA